MSDSLWPQQLDPAGRKPGPLGYALVLSLLLHATVLFLTARHVASDLSLALGLSLRSAPLDVRLIPTQIRQAPVAKLPPERVPALERQPPPAVGQADQASKSLPSPHSTIPKVVELKSGKQLDLSHWQGAKLQGRPLKIRLTINPAGIIASWELLTPDAGPLQLDREAMNIMVRNMDANKTGETHVLIWESQVGIKNGELIAKIYAASDD